MWVGAIGADVPAEVLLGLGDASHWGAWALTAEALRMGAEPKLALVCQALTTEWLQPLLEFDKEPDADQWLIWYDTSGLRSSSNKSARKKAAAWPTENAGSRSKSARRPPPRTVSTRQ